MSLTQKQISRAKHEAEASLANARTLRDQWLAAVNQNPTNLPQKEIDHLTKAFKNRLLSVKWDCEDLEELVGGESGGIKKNKQAGELDDVRRFIEDCKRELTNSMVQLEDFELNKKIFNKHGIVTSACSNTSIPTNDLNEVANNTTPTKTTTATATTIIHNPLHNNPQYERLLNNGGEFPFDSNESNQDELYFDKSQLEANTTIFNNALYEHYEADDHLVKGLNGTKVFNNLTRPNTNAEVFTGTNENEMILEMLETEYYNPPTGLLAKTKYNTTIRKMFDMDRKRFLGTIVFIFSVPFLLMLLLVM